MGKLRPQVLSMPDKGAQARAPYEDLIDLPEQDLRRSGVGKREVTPRQFQPARSRTSLSPNADGAPVNCLPIQDLLEPWITSRAAGVRQA